MRPSTFGRKLEEHTLDIWKRIKVYFSYSYQRLCMHHLSPMGSLSPTLLSKLGTLYSTFSYRLNIMHSTNVNMSYFGFIPLENIAFIYGLKRFDRSPLLYDI